MPFAFEIVIFGVMCVFMAAGAVAWWLEPRRRARRALAGLERSRLGAAREGERVRVQGVARRSRESLRSPVTHRSCIGYSVVVEGAVENEWRLLVRLEDCVPFELHADGVVARVEGPFLFGVEVDVRHDDDEEDLDPEVLEALWRLGVSRQDELGRDRKVRFREALLEEGDPIRVMGRVSLDVDPRGERDTFRGPPRLRVIAGTKREPTVIADEDQPGVLPPAG